MAVFRADPRLVNFYVAITDAARKKGLTVKNKDNFDCTILKGNDVTNPQSVLLAISAKDGIVEVREGNGKFLDNDGRFTYEQLAEAGKYLSVWIQHHEFVKEWDGNANVVVRR